MNRKLALLIGNSSGIGEEVTKRLLDQNFKVIGISRSDSNLLDKCYQHITQDVSLPNYRDLLEKVLEDNTKIDLCIYFAGIGNTIDFNNLRQETKVFEVNLMSAVITTELVLSKMLKQEQGHFIGVSSVADSLISAETPSYSASKSGISKFWEGLGLGLKNKKINISNIRFGFVDTKMAKSPVKPFLISVAQAADRIDKTIKKPRIRVTKPFAIIPLVWLVGLPSRLKLSLNL